MTSLLGIDPSVRRDNNPLLCRWSFEPAITITCGSMLIVLGTLIVVPNDSPVRLRRRQENQKRNEACIDSLNWPLSDIWQPLYPGDHRQQTGCHPLVPSVPRIVPLHRGRSAIVSRIFTRRLAGWFRELPIHLLMLVVGPIFCQKLAPLRRWCQFSGSPTEFCKRSGIQGPKGIVLRQSIKVHEPELNCSSSANWLHGLAPRPVFDIIPTLWDPLHPSASLHPLDTSMCSCSGSLTYSFYTVPNRWGLDGSKVARCFAQFLPPAWRSSICFL